MESKPHEPIEVEILEAETRYWQALKDLDTAAIQALSTEPTLVTGASGVAEFGREVLGQTLHQGGWRLDDFSLSEATVRRLTDDVAVIAYKVEEQMTVDGEPLTVEAAESSTWIRRDGR
ncbi:MAG: nuclear transport factor 2 family protein [Kofleriaceae bacterium]